MADFLRLHSSCASLILPSAPYPQIAPNSRPSCLVQKLRTLRRSLQLPRSYDPVKNFQLPTLEEEEGGESLAAAPPPTDGRINIVINKSIIQQLDLSPAHAVLRGYTRKIGDKTAQDPKELLRRTVGFIIEYEWDNPSDTRELSEMPDIRLWFVRLDAMYPWLPAVLDWRAGELARYAAMLVPHQMKKKEGLVFNPEGLELFVMSKLFTVYPWLQAVKVTRPDARVNDMLRVLGYKIDTELFQLLEL